MQVAFLQSSTKSTHVRELVKFKTRLESSLHRPYVPLCNLSMLIITNKIAF